MVPLIINPVYTFYSGYSISCIFRCWIEFLAYEHMTKRLIIFHSSSCWQTWRFTLSPLCSTTKWCVKLGHMEPSTIPRDRWTANPIKQQHHSPTPTERRKRMQAEQLHSCKLTWQRNIHHFDGILPGKMGDVPLLWYFTGGNKICESFQGEHGSNPTIPLMFGGITHQSKSASRRTTAESGWFIGTKCPAPKTSTCSLAESSKTKWYRIIYLNT